MGGHLSESRLPLGSNQLKQADYEKPLNPFVVFCKHLQQQICYRGDTQSVMDGDPNGRHTKGDRNSSSPVWRPLQEFLQGLPPFLKHSNEITCAFLENV